MYMQSPLPTGDPHQFDLSRALASLQTKLSSEEYNKIWQELRHSGKELDDFYEVSRSSTFQFKDDYDVIKKTERLNEALRHRYYSALATKKKHEEDRDNYFKNEEELSQLKGNFIEDSQELALANSRYVDYNQRFSLQRETLIVRMLDDVSKVNEKNAKLRNDKELINKELHEARSDLADSRNKVREVEKQKEELTGSYKALEKKRDSLKKEGEWLLRQNNKLKEANTRSEKEISTLNDKLGKMAEGLKLGEDAMMELEQKYSELSITSSQQEQLIRALRSQLERAKEEMDNKETNWEERRNFMTSQMEEMKKKMEESRLNNHNTIMRNQKLREKLKAATHKTDVVTRDKLGAVLKEYKTRRTNQELTSKQLELIGEVLELKEEFFRDQVRASRGGRLNRRLNDEVDYLKNRIRLIRENPTAIDPLDGVQEYREVLTRQRFSPSLLLRHEEFHPITSEEIRPIKSFAKKASS
ncbi:uncharacterized protein LOC100177007 [Ciona intestinalis]